MDKYIEELDTEAINKIERDLIEGEQFSFIQRSDGRNSFFGFKCELEDGLDELIIFEVKIIKQALNKFLKTMK